MDRWQRVKEVFAADRFEDLVRGAARADARPAATPSPAPIP
jgi:hypothetical protein